MASEFEKEDWGYSMKEMMNDLDGPSGFAYLNDYCDLFVHEYSHSDENAERYPLPKEGMWLSFNFYRTEAYRRRPKAIQRMFFEAMIKVQNVLKRSSNILGIYGYTPQAQHMEKTPKFAERVGFLNIDSEKNFGYTTRDEFLAIDFQEKIDSLGPTSKSEP